MEGVKSAGRPVWRGRNSWVITPGFCWILTQSLWALWPGAETFCYDLIFLIFLSVSLRMKRMNCLKGQL